MINKSTYYITQNGFKRSVHPMDTLTYAIKHNHDYVYAITNGRISEYYELTPDYIAFIKSLKKEY